MRYGCGWFVAVLISVAGCGGDDSGTGSAAESCAIDVSGAVEATPGCEDPALTFNANIDELTLSFTSPDEDELVVVGSFRAPGEPVVDQSYATGTEGVLCAIGVNDGPLAWNANNTNPDDTRGSCTLVFTEIEEDSRIGDFATYRGTGTVTATMDAIETSGATGTITATIDFEL